MLAPGSGSLNNVRTTKATTVLNAGSLLMSAPPIVFSCNCIFVQFCCIFCDAWLIKRSSLCFFCFVNKQQVLVECGQSKKVLAASGDYSSLQRILKEAF